MATIADTFSQLTGLLAGAGHNTAPVARAGSAIVGCAVAGFAAADYAALAEDELIATHTCIVTHLRAVTAQAALSAAEIARRSAPELGPAGLAWKRGHANPEAMVQSLGGGSKVDAKRLVAVGTMAAEAQAARELEKHNEEHPEFAVPVEVPWHAALGDAVSSGRLGLEAVNSIRNGLGEPDLGVTPEKLADALVGLIEECSRLNADQAHQAARACRNRIDADGIAAREEAMRLRQYFRAWRKDDGMVHGDFELNPENGTFLLEVLDRISGPKRGGPRFVEKGERARAQAIIDDPRSPNLINAEAIIALIHIAVAADPSVMLGSHKPAVRVLITQDTPNTTTGTTGTTGNGGRGFGLIEGHPDPVGPGTIDRHLCDSGSIPIMFDTDGQVVNVGRTLRLFTTRQRAGLAARDGGCMWPGCDRPPSWTEAHHTNEWFAQDGKTDIADGILLCRRDHLRLHNQGWAITRTGTDYWLIPPPAIDPKQKPILLKSKTPLKLQSPVPPQNTPLTEAGHRETPPDGTSDGGNPPEAEHHLRAG